MNCKNSAQNALKVAIFRLQIEKFSVEGAMPSLQTPPHWEGDTHSPNLTHLGASIIAPSALCDARPCPPPRLQILDPPLVVRFQ